MKKLKGNLYLMLRLLGNNLPTILGREILEMGDYIE